MAPISTPRLGWVKNRIPEFFMAALFWLTGYDQYGGYQGKARHVMRLMAVIAPLSALAIWFFHH